MSQKPNFNFTEERSRFETYCIKAQTHLQKMLCRIKDPKTRCDLRAAAIQFFSKCAEQGVTEAGLRAQMDAVLARRFLNQKSSELASSNVISLID